MNYQPPHSNELHELLMQQRNAFLQSPLVTHEARLDRLQRLLDMTYRFEAEWTQAIDADFTGRSPHETQLAEVFGARSGIRHAMRHLKEWMRVRRVHTQMHFWPAHNRLQPQPLGVVGVISPWNYPLLLSLGPTIAALAAGNRVMIKPSELTPHFSAALREAVAQTFTPEELCVVEGDAEVARAFSQLPLDHLVFTGSTAVGKLVAQAAAANLTPVTLELGGKSPAIVDRSADLGQAMLRIAHGKLLNSGQTCIAPDYVMVSRGLARAAAQALSLAMTKLYPTVRNNADYTAIISPRHRQRLLDLLEDARSHGAQVMEVNPAQESFDGRTRKLPPHLVLDPTPQMRVMQEEIFGPILPIVEYDSVDDAIAHVQAGDRPLALYWFGQDLSVRDRILNETHAGGVTINDCLWHIAQENQPFGGIGPSGVGAYHGQWGFDRLSHLKPVFYQSRLNAGFLLRPPYGRAIEGLLRLLDRVT